MDMTRTLVLTLGITLATGGLPMPVNAIAQTTSATRRRNVLRRCCMNRSKPADLCNETAVM